jgi:hypothetical protein
MRNYNNNILKASKQSEKMKLHSDFKKSIEIIRSYPLLVQYIKLSEITYDWFDTMYDKTKDIEIKEMKAKFVFDSIRNFEIYSENGDDNGLKPLINHLIDSFPQMFKI